MSTQQLSAQRALYLVGGEPATDEDLRREVKSLAARSGSGHSALVPLLRDLKRSWGRVPPAALDEIAIALDMDYAKVHSVASFYDLLDRIDRRLPAVS